MKIIKTILLLCLCIFLSTGCYDYRTLEELAYVVAIGVDKDPYNSKNISVTFQIANPQVGSSFSSTAENEDPYEIITLSTPDINTGFDLANITISRRLTSIHAQGVIISEELAKSDRMPLLIDSLARSTDINRLIHIIISKEKASEFLRRDDPQLETRPHKQYQLLHKIWEESGFVPVSNLGKLFQSIDSKTGGFLAIYGTAEKQKEELIVKRSEDQYTAGQAVTQSKNPLQVIGSVVIIDGKAITTLDGEETRLIHLLTASKSDIQYWHATFTDPQNKDNIIVARVKRNKCPSIKIDTREVPVVDLNIKLDLEIETIESLIQYGMDEKLWQQLKASIEKELVDKTLDLIKKVQSEIGRDLFQWSLRVRRNFLTMPEYEAYDWASKFPNAEIKVKYDVNILNFGKQIESIRRDKF